MDTEYADGGDVQGGKYLPARSALNCSVAELRLIEYRADVEERLQLAWLAGANWAHPGVVIEIGDNPYGQ